MFRCKLFASLVCGIILLLLSMYPVSVASQTATSDLPFHIPDAQIRPLRQLVDTDLQKRLEQALRRNKVWGRLMNKKKMAVGIVDLHDPSAVKFARINGDVMMYAASLPKLAILLAASQSLADSTLTATPEVIKDMRIMISRSDNGAATRMIDRVGFDRIEDILTDPRYELYDPKRGGGLWVGKRYAKKGKRYPDPLMGISHGASVTQVCRFYYLLAMGKLVNPFECRRMLGMLEDPKAHHKFVYALDRIVPDAIVYRKSGTWRQWHADSAMVWGPEWRRYIVVGLIEDPNGEQILRNLLPVVDALMKDERAK